MPNKVSQPRRRQARKAAPGPRKALMPAQQRLALEMCEEVYLKALADPFLDEIRGKVCYPSFPAKQSVKYTGVATIPVAIGTGGYGFIAFDPCPSNSETGSIWYTGATYAGTSASAIAASGTGISTTNWSTPTSTSDFAESTTGRGNQFRLVVAGAMARYTGTELNRGGSMFVVTSPQQVSLDGLVLANAAQPTTGKECPVTPDWQTFVLPPAHEEDVEWKDSDQIYPWSDGGGGTGVPSPLMALVFVGTAGNTFNVRLIEHYEATGVGYNNFGSMSHIGRQQIIQSITAASASAVYGPPSQKRSYLHQFAEKLRTITENPIVRQAGSLVFNLGTRYLSARYGGGARMPGMLPGSRQLMLTGGARSRRGYVDVD